MKMQISAKQFYKLVVVYIISNDLIRGIYAFDLKNDVWIPPVIGTLISLLLFTLYMFIYKNNQFDSFDNSLKHILGKILSKILYIFYIIYFCGIVFFNLLDLNSTILIQLLPNYNPAVLIGFMLISIGYLLVKKLEVIVRFANIMFFGIVFIFIAMIFSTLSVHDVHIENILPILYNGYKVIIRPSLEMGYSIPFGELFAIVIIFQHVEKKEKYAYVGNLAIITASVILITITLFNIFIVGPFAMGYGASPAFRLARLIDIEEYIQRLDLVLTGFHMIVVFVKMTILIYAAGLLIQSILKLKEKQVKISYGVMLSLIFIGTMMITRNYTSILIIRRKVFIRYIAIVFEVFIPVLIVILSFMRKNKRKVNPEDIVEYEI